MMHTAQYIDALPEKKPTHNAAPAPASTSATTKPTASPSSNTRFDFGKLLGSGTFSRVYAAYDRHLNATVAVKHMLKATEKDGSEGDALKRQLQEYNLTKGLVHVNIVRVLDCIITDGDVVFVQELASGGDLFDAIRPDVGAPLDVAYRIMTQMAAALEYMIEVGIVHRDIKPENIVLDADGNMKLCDFGMAERTGTLVRGARGTIAYLAPDLLPRRKDLSQKYPVGHSSDMWGIGLIFYALLVGAHPWTKAEPTEKYYASYLNRMHLRSYPWKLFPAELHVFLDRVFEANPAQRCSLTELKSFLATRWTTTVPVVRERVELIREASARAQRSASKSSLV